MCGYLHLRVVWAEKLALIISGTSFQSTIITYWKWFIEVDLASVLLLSSYFIK